MSSMTPGFKTFKLNSVPLVNRAITPSAARSSKIMTGCWIAVVFRIVTILLGFSEPNSFRKAFKKWSGTTPREYREQARQ